MLGIEEAMLNMSGLLIVNLPTKENSSMPCRCTDAKFSVDLLNYWISLRYGWKIGRRRNFVRSLLFAGLL
jgi:hypothetical protein